MDVDEEIHIGTVTFSSLRLIYIFHFNLTPGGKEQRENHCVTEPGGGEFRKREDAAGRSRAKKDARGGRTERRETGTNTANVEREEEEQAEKRSGGRKRKW